MKIILRLFCSSATTKILEQDSTVAEACDLGSIVLELDSDDQMLDRVLELTQTSPGISFHSYMQFTKKEMSQAKYFELEARKTVHETGQDYELNYAYLQGLKFIEKRSNCKIKLLDRVALSKIKLKENMVAGIDEWTAEFLITSEIAAIFKKEQLTGLDLKQVYNPKTTMNYEKYSLLYSDNIMPPLEIDPTIISKENEEGCFHELGCLVYDFQSDEMVKDFNRTAEDLSSNHMPLWVVSARVRECFMRHKLKGWAFLPVMEKGSKMYQDYLNKWESLIQRISINPNNRF